MNSFGVGVYFLTVLWFLTFMLCWVSVHTGHNIGKISGVITTLLTIILVCLPKSDTHDSDDANFYDRLYITRYAILAVLLMSCAAGSVFCFVYICLTPVTTRKVKRFGTLN